MGHTCIVPEIRRLQLVVFDLGGEIALGPNSQLLSERVWSLSFHYLESESLLGQRLWEQMLASVRQRANRPQHKRQKCHEIRVAWERKLGETNSEILMLLGDAQRDNWAAWATASTGLHEGKLRAWVWPAAWASWRRSSNTSAAPRELPGRQEKPVSTGHAAAFCLSARWGLADRLTLCHLPAPDQGPLSAAQGETGAGKVGGKPLWTEHAGRKVSLGLSLCLGLIQLEFVVTAGSREAAVAIRGWAKEVKAITDKALPLPSPKNRKEAEGYKLKATTGHQQ